MATTTQTQEISSALCEKWGVTPDHVLFMCRVCDYTPEKYFRVLESIEESEKPSREIVEFINAQQIEKDILKHSQISKDTPEYKYWLQKRLKTHKPRR